MIDNKIKFIAKQLGELPKIVRSVILIGSHSDNSASTHSDIDILIITHSDLTAENSCIIGEKINSFTKNDNRNTSFNFYNPICERCRLLSHVPYRFHLISHPWSNIKKWLKEKDFITCMWAYKSNVLWGDNPFDEKVIPELNKSVLDNLDGIPGFLREINNILITKDPTSDSHEYARYCKFYMDRISELVNFFPEVSRNISLPSNPTGQNGLIDISNYFSSIQRVVEGILGQISDNGIRSDS